MIGNNRKTQKQKKDDDNINQVILFIEDLIAKNKLKKINVLKLCYLLKENGFMIEAKMEPELPFDAPSLWFELKGQYVILYRGAKSSVFTQLHILHELSHILLGHSPFTKEDFLRGRSIYTDREEMEAELAACQIFFLLNPIKYDHLLNRKYPSAIINRHPNHNGHLCYYQSSSQSQWAPLQRSYGYKAFCYDRRGNQNLTANVGIFRALIAEQFSQSLDAPFEHHISC
jgi:hypothetical protein